MTINEMKIRIKSSVLEFKQNGLKSVKFMPVIALQDWSNLEMFLEKVIKVEWHLFQENCVLNFSMKK